MLPCPHHSTRHEQPIQVMPSCQVNTSDLMKCSDSQLWDNSSAYSYFAKSGDAGGVDITTDGQGVKTYKYVCQDWGGSIPGMRNLLECV